MDINVETYIQKVKDVAKMCNIKIKLVNEKNLIYDGVVSNGLFIENSRGSGGELLVAVKKPIEEWLPVFIHESCHMEQFITKSPIWLSLYDKSGFSGIDTFFSYVSDTKNYKTYNKHIIDAATLIVQDLEYDCERRSVEKIKKYKLPIDTKHYIKTANSYILFYQYAKLKRIWYSKNKAPYLIKEIVDSMPSRFVKNYNKLSTKHIELYDKYYG